MAFISDFGKVSLSAPSLKCPFLRTDHPGKNPLKLLRKTTKGNKKGEPICLDAEFCLYTYVLFLSGTGAVGSPACVGTSPWHLHWHRPASGAGRVGSPPDPQTGRSLAPNWPLTGHLTGPKVTVH